MTSVTFDEAAVREAFQKAISDHVTKFLTADKALEAVGAGVRAAFEKKWTSDRESYMAESVGTAMQQALWQGIQKAVEAAGIEQMITEIVRDHISTPEFKEALTKRALETVRETTFYVKPSPSQPTGDV